MGTRRTTLPGVGTQYDFTTEDGRHLSVVVHHDGRRFLGFYDPDDPDTCEATVPLTPEDAAALAHLIDPLPGGGIRTDGLTWSPSTSPSPAAPLRGQAARRDEGPHPHRGVHRRRTAAHQRPPRPGPRLPARHRRHFVVVGTREGADALAAIIGGE